MESSAITGKVFACQIKKLPTAGESFKVIENQILQFTNILRSWTLGTAHNIKTDPITLGQRFETFSLDCGMMHKNVLAPVLLDKTKPFCIIEPFYFSL